MLLVGGIPLGKPAWPQGTRGVALISPASGFWVISAGMSSSGVCDSPLTEMPQGGGCWCPSEQDWGGNTWNEGW